TGPLGCSCTLSSSVGLANNPTFGQLGGGGGEGNGTAWWDLGQWSSQVNEINNYNNDNNNNNNSYGDYFESLAFEVVPQCLPYQTSQAHNGLGWEHHDSNLSLQQITTLIGNDSDVFRWGSTHATTPLIQNLPLMQRDLTLSTVVDMPMQPWDLQYFHNSSPPMVEEQLDATLQLGQNECALMSPFGSQTTGNTSLEHTPDTAWQTGTGSSSSTSPIGSNGDQLICGYSNCNATRLTQKALKIHQKCHEKKYKCDKDGCPRAFSVPAHLERHRKTHRRDSEESETSRCSACPKTFTREDNLRRHIRKKHPALIKKINAKGSKQKNQHIG
ncbi:hypothetical protein B0T09DRAFT_254867, partial [Sordaria sp. MPI-SDFR-AT-0083]